MKITPHINLQVLHLKPLSFTIAFLAFTFLSFQSHAQHRLWVVPKSAASLTNPNIVDLGASKVLYVTNCGPCHGDKGKGDGPAAQALATKPADHTSTLIQNETDGSLYYKLTEGRSPMPAYKKILTDKQRWGLISYIRTLPKRK